MPNIQFEETQRNQVKLSEEIKAEFTKFLSTWVEDGKEKYVELALQMINNGRHTMVIGFKDFLHFNNLLANEIINEYYRYETDLN